MRDYGVHTLVVNDAHLLRDNNAHDQREGGHIAYTRTVVLQFKINQTHDFTVSIISESASIADTKWRETCATEAVALQGRIFSDWPARQLG